MSLEVNNSYGVSNYAANTAASTAKAALAAEAEATKATQEKKTDGFDKKQDYKPDMDKINEMKSDLKGNMSAFKTMVSSLIQKQGGLAGTAAGFSLKNLFSNLKVDEATRKQAQDAISEDGEWGVEATAGRIFEFAKALSGGDPAMAAKLKDAVKKGFGAAESAWGGKLPEISGQTYDRVMEMFDDWENGDTEKTAPAEGAEK